MPKDERLAGSRICLIVLLLSLSQSDTMQGPFRPLRRPNAHNRFLGADSDEVARV